MITDKSDSQSNAGTSKGINLEYFPRIQQTKKIKKWILEGCTVPDLLPLSNTSTKRLRIEIFYI